MPAGGPKLKPQDQLRNQRRPQTSIEWIEVLNVPYGGKVPPLPRTRVVLTRNGQEEVEILDITRKWWKTVSRMPHCILWNESDWQYALTTALVADAAFCGISSASTELRNREKILGTTWDYRRDLRIKYIDKVEAPKAPEVPNIADYRDL